jgi:hypothetical protein
LEELSFFLEELSYFLEELSYILEELSYHSGESQIDGLCRILHIFNTNSTAFITDSPKFNTEPATHLHKFNIIQHHSTLNQHNSTNLLLICLGGIVIFFGGIVILFGGIVIPFGGIVISFLRGTNRWSLQDPTPLQHKFNSIHH